MKIQITADAEIIRHLEGSKTLVQVGDTYHVVDSTSGDALPVSDAFETLAYEMSRCQWRKFEDAKPDEGDDCIIITTSDIQHFATWHDDSWSEDVNVKEWRRIL